MARIAVLGAGYVGLTSAACLAALDHYVTSVEVDANKVRQLRGGRVTMIEPRLQGLVRNGLETGRLKFVSADALTDMEFVIVCLPTPMNKSGRVDMTYVDTAFARLGDAVAPGCVFVIKSTVPVGTAQRVEGFLKRPDVAVVSNPEFLREGQAVDDFLTPDRIVIGSRCVDAAERVAALYARLDAPIIHMDNASAELVKYAANSFLATRLSFVNEIANLCDAVGANIAAVSAGLKLDPRIGSAYLRPGPGWGGSCLPKDTAALLHSANDIGLDLPVLRAAIDSNEMHRARIIQQITNILGANSPGKRVGLLGLTFKAGTSDLRGSPALAVAHGLSATGVELLAHDPAVLHDVPGQTDGIVIVPDAYQAVTNAHVVVVLTEWPQFKSLDWSRVADLVAEPMVVDTRNFLDPWLLACAGLTWRGIGIAPRRQWPRPPEYAGRYANGSASDHPSVCTTHPIGRTSRRFGRKIIDLVLRQWHPVPGPEGDAGNIDGQAM
jgi:UDPglucose 6-dehydrogenase